MRPKRADEEVLVSAASKIGGLLALTEYELGSILGLPSADIDQLRSGKNEFSLPATSYEAAHALLRLHDSLNALFGD